MTTKTIDVQTSGNGMEKTISDGENTVMLKVRYSRTWQEWSVRYYLNGRMIDNKCYFASDKEDAVLTMCTMALSEQVIMTPSDNQIQSDKEKALLQKLWDHNRLMQDTLIQFGRKLAESDIDNHSRTYWIDKALMTAKNLSDHDSICDVLEKHGVDL